MRQFAGHKRFVWNRALSIEQSRYRRGEKMLGCTRMMRELTMWRNSPDPHSSFLKDAPVHALQCVLSGTVRKLLTRQNDGLTQRSNFNSCKMVRREAMTTVSTVGP